MRADGAISLEMIDRLVEHYAGDGADGLFVCGTTGESMSLSTDERMRAAERWRHAAGPLPVGVNVTHTSLPDCKALAAHAEKIGAVGIGAMAPFFFKPRSAEDLVAFCAEVAAAAPNTPFYYYHYPRMTGVTLTLAEVYPRALERIPTLAGFKCSTENLADAASAMEACRGDRPVTAMYGVEAMMLPALASNVRDFIGGTFNFNLPTFRRLRDAFDRGDLATARAEQASGRAVVVELRRHDFPAAAKAVMKMIGLDCGPVRLPMHTPSEPEVACLKKSLENLGFFARRERR
jgi:N-acetylneuraminate lyase